MRINELTKPRFPGKVTDEAIASAVADGFDPTIWYHGTRRRFEQFRDPSKETRKSQIEELGSGIYLTSRYKTAWWWSGNNGCVMYCVVRQGKHFDFDQALTPEGIKTLHAAHTAYMTQKWGPKGAYGLADFKKLLQQRGPSELAKYLPYVGYVAGFKKSSQVPDQLIVFNQDDVRILARHKWKDI